MSDDDEYYSNAGSDSDSEPEITKKSNLLKPKIGLVPSGLKKMTEGATIDDESDEDSDSEVVQIGGIGDDDEPEIDIMSNVSSDDDASEVAESEDESEEEENEEVGEEPGAGESEAVTGKKSAKSKTKKAVQI